MAAIPESRDGHGRVGRRRLGDVQGSGSGDGWARAAVKAVLAVGGKHDPKSTYKLLPAK